MSCHRFPGLLAELQAEICRTTQNRTSSLERIVVVTIFEPWLKRYQEQNKPVETHSAEIRYVAA